MIKFSEFICLYPLPPSTLPTPEEHFFSAHTLLQCVPVFSKTTHHTVLYSKHMATSQALICTVHVFQDVQYITTASTSAALVFADGFDGPLDGLGSGPFSFETVHPLI